MLLQGYRARLCLLKAWQTAHLTPYYSLMTDYSWQLTSQKLHSKASPPSLSQCHLCSGTGARICPGNCPCRPGSRGPAAEVPHSPRLSCARLWLLFACVWNTHWRDSEWEAGGSPYTWHCLVFLPGKAAGFRYPSWAVTGVEILGSFTTFPTRCKRHVAAGTHLHPYLPVPCGFCSAYRAGSMGFVFALAAWVWLWTTTVSSLERDPLCRREPFTPSSVHFSPL